MRRPLVVAVLAVGLLSAGCTNDFSPQGDLLGLRVLALVATPLEVAPRQAITIRPHDYVPPGSTIVAQRWTFCPISAGSVTAYACAVPQCEVELTPSPDGSVTANPTAIIETCLGFTGGTLPRDRPGPAPDGLPLPDRDRHRGDPGRGRCRSRSGPGRPRPTRTCRR